LTDFDLLLRWCFMDNPYESHQTEAAACPSELKESLQAISDENLLGQRKYSASIYGLGILCGVWLIARILKIYRSYDSLPAAEKVQGMLIQVANNYVFWLYIGGMICACWRSRISRYLGMLICAAFLYLLIITIYLSKKLETDMMSAAISAMYAFIIVRALIGFVRGSQLFGESRLTHADLTKECRRRLLK